MSSANEWKKGQCTACFCLSKSQGMPNMASKPPEAKGGTWIDSAVTPGMERPVLAQESVGPFCSCYSHAPLPFNLTRPS